MVPKLVVALNPTHALKGMETATTINNVLVPYSVERKIALGGVEITIAAHRVNQLILTIILSASLLDGFP